MKRIIVSTLFFLGICLLFRSLLNLIPALKKKKEEKRQVRLMEKELNE